jgi:hypothetical protein
MQVASDGGASGGAFVYTPLNLFQGSVTLSFSVPTAGAYRVFGRVKCPDQSHNSFVVVIDGGAQAMWGPQPSGDWTWQQVTHWNGQSNVPQTYDLAAGDHSVRFGFHENESRLDMVEITNEPGYNP